MCQVCVKCFSSVPSVCHVCVNCLSVCHVCQVCVRLCQGCQLCVQCVYSVCPVCVQCVSSVCQVCQLCVKFVSSVSVFVNCLKCVSSGVKSVSSVCQGNGWEVERLDETIASRDRQADGPTGVWTNIQLCACVCEVFQVWA